LTGKSVPLQRLEPLLVQALVPELPIEALDVALLHGPARLDQDVPYAMPLRATHEPKLPEAADKIPL
jgi:hypothetical protein